MKRIMKSQFDELNDTMLLLQIFSCVLAGPTKKNTSGMSKRVQTDTWSFDHRIDFDNSSVIDKGSFRKRKTL